MDTRLQGAQGSSSGGPVSSTQYGYQQQAASRGQLRVPVTVRHLLQLGQSDTAPYSAWSADIAARCSLGAPTLHLVDKQIQDTAADCGLLTNTVHCQLLHAGAALVPGAATLCYLQLPAPRRARQAATQGHPPSAGNTNAGHLQDPAWTPTGHLQGWRHPSRQACLPIHETTRLPHAHNTPNPPRASTATLKMRRGRRHTKGTKEAPPWR